MSNKHLPHDLQQLQSLPLEAKERMSLERTKVWFESWIKYTIYNSKTNKTRFVTHTEEPNENGCFVKKRKKVNGKMVEVDELVRGTKLMPTEHITKLEDGQVYVSFSGGKDSTVLADLCARVCQRYGYALHLLFVNTGLEYPEIQKFVKTFAEWLRETYEIEVHLEILRPEMRFDEVLKTYGYPVISKEVAQQLYEVKQSAKLHGIDARETSPYDRKFNPESAYCKKNPSYCMQRWDYMIDAEFDVSHMCCMIMKKKPAKKYEKQTGRKPILGTMAAESRMRRSRWLQFGCNAFEAKRASSNPLSFWTVQDILHYIKKHNVPYCSVYGDIIIETEDDNQLNLIDYLECYEDDDKLKTTGCDRTGCIFCMFGCHLEKEPNSFQRLKETHPRQYEYCINGGEMVDGKWQPSKEGLGLGKVLDYIGVKYD